MDRIVIDSRDRLSTSASSTDFEVILPNSVKVKHVKLHSITIPGSFFNIEAPNNVILFKETANCTATLTPGYYSGTQLATAIGAAMTAASSSTYTYTVVYNGTPTFTLSWTSTGSFQLLSNATTPWAQLGLVNQNTTAGTTLTSTNPILLDRPFNLFVSIEGLDKTVYTGSSSFGACFQVPVQVGQDNTYNHRWDKFVLHDQSVFLQRVKCRLLQQDGTVLNLHNGDWTVSIWVSPHDPDEERACKRRKME